MKFYFSLGNNRFATLKKKENQPLSSEEVYRNALLDDLRKTKEALETAYMGFDNVTEPDLIDCYIFELNSVITRYNYLLGQVGKLSNKEEVYSRMVPILPAHAMEVPLYSELTGDLPVLSHIPPVSTMG